MILFASDPIQRWLTIFIKENIPNAVPKRDAFRILTAIMTLNKKQQTEWKEWLKANDDGNGAINLITIAAKACYCY